MVDTMKDIKEVKKSRKGGAVFPRPGEIKQIISGKMTERVHLQQNYRESYFIVRVKEARLTYMKELIDNADSQNLSHITFQGTEMALSVAKAEFALEHHYYKIAISNEQYLRQALENVGFTESDFMLILNDGIFIKDEKKLLAMEKKAVKKKLMSGDDEYIG